MKSKQGLAGKILAGVAALVLLGFAVPLQAGANGEVKVIRLRGNARYSTDQKTWKELKKGKVLKSGTLIQTAPNSIMDLCLNEGVRSKNSSGGSEASVDNVLRIFENSSVSLDKLAAEEIQLDLRAGAIMGTVGRLSADAKYEIRLPHGFLGIRGGTYIADASGVANVIDGSAAIVIIAADKSLTTKKIAARQGYDPTAGAVVSLHMDRYPLPLTCADSELPPATQSGPTSGVPHGSGMGGALRKF